MFAASRVFSLAAKRTFSTSAADLSKVAVLGAAGGIGQPLSLLLKENRHRLYGVTTLDVVRASRFVAEIKNLDPKDVNVTVVGGHSGVTIVPLLSQTGLEFTKEELDSLTHRIQFGGDEVVQAKNGTGSATLSMAFAGARFANSVLEATVGGKKGVVEPSFVKSDVFANEGVEYFSTNIELGPEGVEKINALGEISDYEKELISKAVPELKKNITKGNSFVQ
ncbi:hypothetical protein G6F56_001125 [Rhizopus delemar]|nr:hypothetical protein G6F56_001125 [Rhizopus delemar]